MKPEQKARIYLVCAVVFAVCIVILIGTTFWPSGEAASAGGAVSASSSNTESMPEVENAALAQAIADNVDTVACLMVPGIEINSAVLQTADNDYSLTRDERKQPSARASKVFCKR